MNIDWKKTFVKVIMLFTVCQLSIYSTDLKVYASSEEFPEGMTQEEKEQMLTEMYEDIEADVGYSDISTEDSSSMTDEEFQKLLEESLPSDEELKEIEDYAGEQVVNIASYKTSYDKNKKLYRYTFSKGGSILTSVPNGGYTNYAVALVPEDDAQIMYVTLNGEPVTQLPDEEGAYLFRDVGDYEFWVCGAKGSSLGIICGSFKITDVSVPVRTSFVWSPEGYLLKGYKQDGEYHLSYESKYTELKQDGMYELFYEPKADLKNVLPDYSITLIRDTTPPNVEFIGEVRNGKFEGEIRYELAESDTELSIYYNGQPAISESHVLATAGNYMVLASDKTGNTRTYTFTIVRRGYIPWKAVGIVSGFLLIIAIVIALRARKNMSVKQNFYK
ncbi:MAG: hypothetical protein K6A23_06125 [Butyrivibrio sp.]|nr:hypothetical protein [Butyrivibrio sp.]